ncbi:MAG: HAMP domain-containing histidine kinase [Tissierellales bacterium]|nr:HAMP domain-containing histidine kinase [Tissierellales bacterium]MBN2826433.1 HAMP domain-containing histidine kinase [Tissierellales bacterium]
MNRIPIREIMKKGFINRVMFSIVGLSFIILFGFMLMDSFAKSGEVTSENEKESLLNQLYYVSESINYYFYDLKNDLELLSYTIYQNEENTLESIKNFSFKQQFAVKSVTLIDNFQEIIFEKYDASNDFPNINIYQEIIEDGKRIMKNRITPAEVATKIDIYLINEHEYVISFGVKSVPKEGVQSLIIITVALNDIYDNVMSPGRIPVEFHPILKDKYGNILIHNNTAFIGRNSLSENIDNNIELEGSEFKEVVKDQLTGKTDARLYTSVYKIEDKLMTKKMVSAFMPLYFLDDYWIISMTLDYDKVYNEISSVNNRLILFAMLITFTFALLMSIIHYLYRNKLTLENEASQLRKFNLALEELHNREALLTKNTKYRTMGYMTMGIVHELNNLLTPVIGLTEMLKDEISDKEQGMISLEDVNVINESAVHSYELLQQVLLIGRQNKSYLTFKGFDIKEVLEKSMNVVEVSFGKKVNIVKEFEENPLFVYGNKSQLVQVFINIAINGIHAMDGAGILKVVLQCNEGVKKYPETRMKNTRYIEVIIQDNGCGIDEKDIHNIFLPFYTTKEDGNGTGLGLSVASDIIKNHKGEIHIDSKIGQGTSVHIYLPLLNLEENPDNLDYDKKNISQNSPKVCLVNLKKELSEYLESALIEYDVFFYLNQSTYSAMLSSGRIKPDILVISDAEEDVDGVQLAKLAKRKYPNIKILYLSESKIEELNIKTQKIIDEYYQGPMDFMSITEKIKTLID